MTAGRSQLRLLTQHLTPNDIAKIGVFLRVGDEKLQCEWQVVSEGATDVLMLSGNEPDTVLGLLENPHATLCVVDEPVDTPHDSFIYLVRPLQYEAFIDTLLQVERLALKQPTAPAAKLPVVEQAVAPSPAPALPAAAVYRLRRWPSADVLQGHRHQVRLASFLSTRHLALAELVNLSNVAEDQCQAFLARLMAADLLDMKNDTNDSPTMSTPVVRPRAKPESPARGRKVDQGLINKLRRVLGMGDAR